MTTDTEDKDTEMSEPIRIGAPNTPPIIFHRIELEKVDKNLFLGKKKNLWLPPSGRVYGGQVIGQSLAAAIRSTPPEKKLHSMHCYFLRAGVAESDIVYSVKALRDGKSYCTRSVTAIQFGEPIFVLTASFHRKEESQLRVQPKIPFVPPPHKCLEVSTFTELRKQHDSRVNDALKLFLDGWLEVMKSHPVEFRYIQLSDSLASRGKFNIRDFKNVDSKVLSKFPYLQSDSGIQRTVVWLKAKEGIVDEDMASQRALFGYVSDWFLLGTALGGGFSRLDTRMMASLDHSMWFHADFNLNEWVLFDVVGQASQDGRGLSRGRLFRKDGTLAVTCLQEGVVRVRKKKSKANL